MKKARNSLCMIQIVAGIITMIAGSITVVLSVLALTDKVKLVYAMMGLSVCMFLLCIDMIVMMLAIYNRHVTKS